MATIKEIAEKAGVSIGTVDRVLHNRGRVSEVTEKKILKIAAELNYKPNELGVALRAKHRKINIGYMIPLDEDTPSEFYNEIKRGAEEEIDELDKYAITVNFYRIGFDFSTGEDIYPQLSDEEWSKLDGLITLGGDSPMLTDILSKAHDRDIPVILYNMDAKSETPLAAVQCNYIQAGCLAAGICGIMASENGKIGILTSDSDKVPSFTKRLYGFQKELQRNYPHMKISYIRQFSGNIASQDAAAFLERLKEQYPATDIIYVVNPGDYRIFRSIHTVMGEKVKTVTNDITEKQKEFLENGMISVTITQNPRQQGKLPLQILKDYLVFHKMPERKTIFTNLEIHLKQNLEVMQSEETTDSV